MTVKQKQDAHKNSIHALEAENLIQRHMDSGLSEELAVKAAITTLEYCGCNLEGRNNNTPLKQKAYNYLVGHGSKLTREKALVNNLFKI